VINECIEALGKTGVKLDEGWPAGVDPAEQYKTYRFLLESTFASNLRDDQEEEARKRAAVQDGGDAVIQAFAWTAPHKHFLAWSSARVMARAVWQEYFRTHDVFLMPTAFVPAFPHDHRPFSQRTIDTPDGPREYNDMFFWISFASLTGLPATTAPIGQTRDGLPVGIQVLGPYLEDATSIDVAGKLADLVGGFRVPEGY